MDCLNFLVSAGAALAHTDKYGWNAAHLAAANGRVDCVTRLLELGLSLKKTVKSEVRV